MNHSAAHSQSSSKKSFPPTAHTTSQRNAPVAAKTLVGVHPTQQSSPKPAKTRSPLKKTSPSKQEQLQQQQHHHQPSDDSSSPPSPQKKRSNRSAGKVLSAGSLADVKPSKPLSQESVTILKRGNPGNLSNILADPFTVPRDETVPPNHMGRNSFLSKLEQSRSRDSSPSRRRNVQPPSKSRRAQRRKDVEAITDALQNSEADMLGTSPPQANDSTSSSDSNDDVLVITGNEKVVTVSKAEPRRKSKRERVVSSPPTTTSVTAFPPLTATVATEKNAVAEVKSSPLRVTFAKSASQTRRSSSPAMEIRHHVAPFTVASPLGLASTTVSETVIKAAPRTPPTSPPQSMTSPLYAGPTFSNSPAPNTLPLPSFNSRGLGETSPVPTSVLHPNTYPTTPTATRSRTTSATSFLAHHQSRNGAFEADEDIFRMDNVGELHAPMYHQDMRARSRDPMGLLPTFVATQPKSVPHPAFAGVSTPQLPSFQGHQLPLKMMRSHPFQNGITREMTMSLRNMLKIAQD